MMSYTRLAEALGIWVQIQNTSTDRPHTRRGKRKATIEKAQASCLGPPILLLVVVRRLLVEVLAGRVVVVASLGLVVVVVNGGCRHHGSVVWFIMRVGQKRKQSNREYSSKVLSKTYIRINLSMQHFQRRLYVGGLDCRKRE